MKKRVFAAILCLALVFALLPAKAFAAVNDTFVDAVSGLKPTVLTEPTRGTPATVSTLDELQAALADDLVNEVVVTALITLTNGTVLDGKGKTVRVPVPAADENGKLLDDNHTPAVSKHGVFYIASGSVELSNMTVMGGREETSIELSDLPAIENNGTLTMTEVTVTRSNRGIKSAGKLILENCCITRNAANCGGGMENTPSGTAVLDGCSFSENRSLGASGGGGAIQNSGTMYINNTVIANNSSTEIGGAINHKGSGTLYMMNSTVCGNVTTSRYGISSGGGIGVNNAYLYAVNSIFADNKYISGSTVSISDIGIYSGSPSPKSVSLYNCLYGEIQARVTGDYSIAEGCSTVTALAFAGYRTDGILWQQSGTTTGFSHPQLLKAPGTEDMYYAPLTSDTDHDVHERGVFATFFDYTNLSNIKMSFKLIVNDSETPLGGLGQGGTQVMDTVEGGTRDSFVMGASEGSATTQKLYTVTRGTATNGSFTGVSEFGDSYLAGTQITVTAQPDPGYGFEKWTIGTSTIMAQNPYTFAVNADVVVTPSFKQLPVQRTITLSADPTAGGTVSGDGTFDENSSCTVTATANQGYRFIGWTEGGATVSVVASYTFVLTANRTLVAQFEAYTPPTTPTITSSGGAVFPQGAATGNAVFTVKSDLSGFNVSDHFASATLDGAPLDLGAPGAPGADGSVADGSIVLTIDRAKLNTLAVGNHPLVVAFKGALTGTTVSGVIRVTAPAPIPATGDGSMPWLWLGVLLMSAGALAASIVRGRGKRQGS